MARYLPALAVACVAGVASLTLGVDATTYCATEANGVLSINTGAAQCAGMSSAAWGTFTDAVVSTGWDRLAITTNASYPDSVQAEAAGLVEGFATGGKAAAFMWNNFPNGTVPPALMQFLESNYEWVKTTAAVKNNGGEGSDPFWIHAGLLMSQLDGMISGFRAWSAATGNPLGKPDALVLAAQGDILDLDNIFPPTMIVDHVEVPQPGFAQIIDSADSGHPRVQKLLAAMIRRNRQRKAAGKLATPSDLPITPDWAAMTKAEFNAYLLSHSHCSALVKVTPDYGHLYFSHSTWQSYLAMGRIFKQFEFGFSAASQTASQRMTFSSYPGALSSLDDYYLTGESNLVAIETTNSIFNFSLYSEVTYESALSWTRAMIANRAANSGPQWFSLFSRHNSGTYNNQWMVIDNKLFTPKQELQANLLWVGEQIPGLVQSADMTNILSYGYWASYNVPYFENIFNISGYPGAIAAQGGDMLDYQGCVRAQMFREYQSTIGNMAGLQYIMQYNNYLYDPISMNNPIYSIAARGDLADASQGGFQLFGAIDNKASEYSMSTKTPGAGGRMWAYPGPTPQQIPFAWANVPANITYRNKGMPAVFNFSYVLF